MTVKELKEKIKDLDDDLRVFTYGYEGGYCDAEDNFKVHEFNLEVNSAWYYGPHEIKEDNTTHGEYKSAKGIII